MIVSPRPVLLARLTIALVVAPTTLTMWCPPRALILIGAVVAPLTEPMVTLSLPPLLLRLTVALVLLDPTIVIVSLPALLLRLTVAVTLLPVMDTWSR